jgi:hypothetical protein
MTCGGHVYWRIGTKLAIFIDDLPSFDSFGKAVSEKKIFLEINQSETRIASSGHVSQRIGTKLAIFIKGFPRMLPTKFWFIWPSGFRGDNFLEINQSKTRIAYGRHVCQRIGTKWAIFIEDLPRILPTKFRFIWQSGFRGEDFLEINQSETRIVCGGHVCKRIGTKWAIFIKDLPRRLPTKFRFIWPSGFRGEDFLEINQSETRIACGGHVC